MFILTVGKLNEFNDVKFEKRYRLSGIKAVCWKRLVFQSVILLKPF